MLSICSLLAAASAICGADGLPFSLSNGPQTEGHPGLKTFAHKRRLMLGAEVPLRHLQNNADQGKFIDAVTSNFDFVELENEFKPPAVWKGPRDYDFSAGDFLVGAPGKTGWAQQNKLKVRGHVLIYASDNGYTLPQWIRTQGADISTEEASALLHDYIFAFAGRYRGKIAMWDVVNEAIDDRPNNGNPFNLKNSFWFRKLGKEFLVLAFKWAHEADPKAQLYYNDYGVEGGGEKAKQMLELGKWLKEQGTGITGLGLQYHIDCHTKIAPGDGHYGLIEDIRKAGLSYMITELDVAVPIQSKPAGDPDSGLIPKDPADLERQAEVFASVYQMALDSKNCKGVQTWGVTDRYSWIPGFSRGRNGAALLLDKDYAPKPAYNSVEAVLRGK